MYRQLDPDRIVETADRLQRRIQERFPDSDLSRVAAELLTVTRGAQARAEQIERPILSLRIGLGLIVATVIVAAAATGFWIALQKETSNWADLAQGLDAALNVFMLVGAAVFFLVTIERQLTRRMALRALHELRVLARVVELHQLTKDPERLVSTGLETPSSPTLEDPDHQHPLRRRAAAGPHRSRHAAEPTLRPVRVERGRSQDPDVRAIRQPTPA